MSSLTEAVVHNEGCDLHYYYQGKGPLVLFVPGGNGHARQYNQIMEALSDRFTCVAFDRRGMSASKVKEPKRLNPFQQARDMRAVITAMGFEKAIIFGSSGGGVLTFVFAQSFPEAVEHAIAHEAPTMSILPDYMDLYDWHCEILEVLAAQGWKAAAVKFREMFVNFPQAENEKLRRALTEEENNEHFFTYEMDVFPHFTPNFHSIRERGTSVGVMRGVLSEDAPYARTTYEQAKILDCPRMDVPGHHLGFESEVEDFVPYFYKMLETLEEKKRTKA